MSSAEHIKEFSKECKARIAGYAGTELAKSAAKFMKESTAPKYSYNFSFLGRPIIQYPQDMVAVQELIWEVKPDLIIETGIAHGGSLIMSATMLAMVEYCEAVEAGENLDPTKPLRKAVGVDIDIREHNRKAIESHPLSNRIEILQGSSVDPEIVRAMVGHASGCESVLVLLDSNHTHDHVLAELNFYAPLVTLGSYCVVFDTIIEDLPYNTYPDRPWGKGNSPKTAVWEFLNDNPEFEIAEEIDNKLLISVAPNGYLRRVTKSAAMDRK